MALSKSQVPLPCSPAEISQLLRSQSITCSTWFFTASRPLDTFAPRSLQEGDIEVSPEEFVDTDPLEEVPHCGASVRHPRLVFLEEASEGRDAELNPRSKPKLDPVRVHWYSENRHSRDSLTVLRFLYGSFVVLLGSRDSIHQLEEHQLIATAGCQGRGWFLNG